MISFTIYHEIRCNSLNGPTVWANDIVIQNLKTMKSYNVVCIIIIMYLNKISLAYRVFEFSYLIFKHSSFHLADCTLVLLIRMPSVQLLPKKVQFTYWYERLESYFEYFSDLPTFSDLLKGDPESLVCLYSWNLKLVN